MYLIYRKRRQSVMKEMKYSENLFCLPRNTTERKWTTKKISERINEEENFRGPIQVLTVNLQLS